MIRLSARAFLSVQMLWYSWMSFLDMLSLVVLTFWCNKNLGQIGLSMLTGEKGVNKNDAKVEVKYTYNPSTIVKQTIALTSRLRPLDSVSSLCGDKHAHSRSCRNSLHRTLFKLRVLLPITFIFCIPDSLYRWIITIDIAYHMLARLRKAIW